MANRYDDAVKALCAVGLDSLCAWLGVKVPGGATPTRLTEAAPPATTRQVDLLVEVDARTWPASRTRRAASGWATVELASRRLDPATINRTWEESAMPIPSILNRRYDEGREVGRGEGKAQGLTQAVASLLRVRFGDDERIEAVAERLAGQGATHAMAAVERAGSLDELA